jgi:hypothetical protein
LDADLFRFLFDQRRGVERGHEDRNAGKCLGNLAGCLETVQFGHREVEDDQIGLELLCSVYGLNTVFRLRANIPSLVRLDQMAKLSADMLLVVGDEDPHMRTPNNRISDDNRTSDDNGAGEGCYEVFP